MLTHHCTFFIFIICFRLWIDYSLFSAAQYIGLRVVCRNGIIYIMSVVVCCKDGGTGERVPLGGVGGAMDTNF